MSSLPFSLPALVVILWVVFCSAGLSGCAGTRADGVQRRQDSMTERAEARAGRRAIRSDGMDARTQAMFDSM